MDIINFIKENSEWAIASAIALYAALLYTYSAIIGWYRKRPKLKVGYNYIKYDSKSPIYRTLTYKEVLKHKDSEIFLQFNAKNVHLVPVSPEIARIVQKRVPRKNSSRKSVVIMAKPNSSPVDLYRSFKGTAALVDTKKLFRSYGRSGTIKTVVNIRDELGNEYVSNTLKIKL